MKAGINQSRERIVRSTPSASIQRGAGVPTLGVPRATFYPLSEARSRASSSIAPPGPACVRTRVASKLARNTTLRRSPCPRITLSMKALCCRAHLVPDPAPRTSPSGAIRSCPCYTKPELVPRASTRPGPGISPGSGGPNAGRPSTSMSCSTSSAAASWAGWLPIGPDASARRGADRRTRRSSKASSPQSAHPASSDRAVSTADSGPGRELHAARRGGLGSLRPRGSVPPI